MIQVKFIGAHGSVDCLLKPWTFPGGERNVKFLTPITTCGRYEIKCLFKSSDDLVDLLMVTNALRHAGVTEISLNIPYFPFARQDRVMTDGEPFALQAVVDVIKMLNFTSVSVEDPHSDVLAGMFPAGMLKVKPQHTLWAGVIGKELRIDESRVYDDMAPSYPKPCLVSPDAGALKKIYKLAKELELPVVEAGKQRNVATGEIVSTTIDANEVAKYQTFFIVDDICDGGRTFIELAKVIRPANTTAKLVLCVTHGIFSKGKEVLTDVFDEVMCINDLSKVSK